jgi:hypothetical protein
MATRKQATPARNRSLRIRRDEVPTADASSPSRMKVR